MRFVVISDTHSKHDLVKLPKGDVLLHAGDISYKGRYEDVVAFLDWFGKQKFQHKIFIAGNHDFFFEKANEKEIKKIIPPNITYLKDSGTEINGIKVWGSPVTPWFFNWAFNRKRGEEIRRHWELIPPDTDILMTHGPAYGFLDLTSDENHAGCQDLLRRLLVIKPKFHLFGHIHESYGNVKRSGIHLVNASLVNDAYDLVHKPFVFDL